MLPALRSRKQCRKASPFAIRYDFTTALMCFTLVASLLMTLSFFAGSSPTPALQEEELQELINTMKGDDNRLMRWDATKQTSKKQRSGGCDSLPDALSVITMKRVSEKLKGMACEYATWCITDNPVQRKIFSDYPGIHSAVVELVPSTSPYASSMAGHLTYIATFSNAKNHEGFQEAGAVEELATVVKNEQSENIQIMWAAAALQNLAASYCDTKGDGRCYWRWKRDDVLAIGKDSLPLLSDGTAVRQKMLQDTDLVERLNKLACTGPVHKKKSSSNPFPGDNAVAGKHDQSPNIVAWAAAGALKNLALDSEARPRIDKEPFMACFCRLAHSPDWLEENKGGAVVHHLRGTDGCWFGKNGDDYENGKLCIDDKFTDNEGYTCSDYGDATEAECKAKNRKGVSANTACCPCGGGYREKTPRKSKKNKSKQDEQRSES